MFRANVPAPLQGAKGLSTFHRACYARLISGSPPGWQAVRRKPTIVRQSSGHFSRPKERFSVRHYSYFLTISKQKPGKRYFHEKKLNREVTKTQRFSICIAKWKGAANIDLRFAQTDLDKTKLESILQRHKLKLPTL
jgi:hypothetical protein